jgi:hypothetical protein
MKNPCIKPVFSTHFAAIGHCTVNTPSVNIEASEYIALSHVTTASTPALLSLHHNYRATQTRWLLHTAIKRQSP